MEKRDLFLHHSNEHGVMTRPCWDLLHTLPIFSKAVVSGSGVYNAREIAEHLVNVPSSVI